MDRVETTYGTLDQFLEHEMIGAVVVGTSEGVPGGNVEELATCAAVIAGLPVFAIEDFPGNYRQRADCRLEGLFVEDDLARNLAGAYIYVTGNPRYDALKTIDCEYLRVSTRALLGLGLQRVVLWAGQPDGNNSYLACRICRKRVWYFCLKRIRGIWPISGVAMNGCYRDWL